MIFFSCSIEAGDAEGDSTGLLDDLVGLPLAGEGVPDEVPPQPASRATASPGAQTRAR